MVGLALYVSICRKDSAGGDPRRKTCLGYPAENPWSRSSLHISRGRCCNKDMHLAATASRVETLKRRSPGRILFVLKVVLNVESRCVSMGSDNLSRTSCSEYTDHSTYKSCALLCAQNKASFESLVFARLPALHIKGFRAPCSACLLDLTL